MAGQWGSAFPRWSFLESRGQVPNPFGTSLAPFTMKRTKVILKGFGTWPHFFQHGPKWTKQRSGSKLLWDQLIPFQNEKNQNDFTRVWNLPQFCQHEPKWKSRGQFSNPFVTSLAFPATKTTKTISKGFGTWSHFFQPGPKWKNRGQVPNRLGTSLDFFKTKTTNIILKGFAWVPFWNFVHHRAFVNFSFGSYYPINVPVPKLLP